MTNQIIHVAIHDLQRTESGFKVELGNNDMVPNATIQRVLDTLHDLYNRRPSKSYGKFSESPDSSPTQSHLSEYWDAPEKDFIGLTTKMMETLRHRASLRAAAGAGHVFFVHFNHEGNDYLLVAILTDKLGAALTKSFEVRDVQHLDMDGFRFAGRIDLTSWKKSEERYIGFLKGKGNISDYFKEFLGCDTTIQNRKDTSDLVDLLKLFTDEQKMEGEAKDAFLRKAKDICDRSAKAKEPIDFDVLSNELFPIQPDILKAKLGDPQFKLSDGFIPHRGALGALVKFKAVTPLWSIEFERSALSSNKIIFDPAANTLTLTELPAELAAELKEEQRLDDPA